MFYFFERRGRSLAFRTDSHEIIRAGVYSFAETTLNAWLQGRERAYAVRDVLREIRAVFGESGEGAVSLIEQAMQAHEDERLPLVTEAVQRLAKQLRGSASEMC